MTAAALVLALAAAAAALPRAPSTCPASEATSGPGVLDPFRAPAAAASQLNADGKLLYRQGRWEEARVKYRAAEAADPEFLAPALNVACSFVRQERYGEAMAEVERLLGRAYLPWSREVLEAADLGALKIRAEARQLQAVLAGARSRWAEGLGSDVLLIARLRPPLKLEGAAAVDPAEAQAPLDRSSSSSSSSSSQPASASPPRALVLGQRQELFAWSPRTRRYRQLTHEEGKVLAVARSSDRRKVVYLTAEKLLRGPGAARSLRGVTITELDLSNLQPLGRGRVDVDVRSVEVLKVGAGFAYRVETSDGAPITYLLDDGRLQVRAIPRAVQPLVKLTAAGVAPVARPRPLDDGCPAQVRDVRPGARLPAGGFRSEVVVSRPGRPPREFPIGGPHGAGLAGLPIP